MTIPVVYDFPVKRPGIITAAQWFGGDADLELHVSFTGLGGQGGQLVFQTQGTEVGEICLPTSTDLNNLGPRARDILVAHTRMACMVAGLAVPGSKEFLNAFIQSDSNNLQTALGTVKVSDVRMVDDQCFDIDFKVGTGPAFTVRADHGELNNYTFVPSTQLLIIPGSVKKEFPTYVHDFNNGKILTQSQKDAISTYILGLEPWI